MRLGRHGGRVLWVMWLTVTACGSSRPPALQPSGAAETRPQPAPRTAGAPQPNRAGTATVSGTLVSRAGKPLSSASMVLSRIEPELPAPMTAGDVRVLPDGSFAFRNVAPGLYEIRARAEVQDGDVALFATYRLRVSGRDVGNLELLLMPGARMSGTVEYAASRGRPPRSRPFVGLRVRCPFVDGSNFGDALTGDVAPNGSFQIRGLMSGKHYVTVEGLAEPWVLERVVWGGRDVTELPIEVEAGQVLEELRLTITDVAHEVTGRVRDAEGRPAAGALVLVIPASPQFWTRVSRRFARLQTDGEGRYRVRGLPAGEYRAVATLDLTEPEVFQPKLLTELSERGVALTLTEPAARVLDLPITELPKRQRPSIR